MEFKIIMNNKINYSLSDLLLDIGNLLKRYESNLTIKEETNNTKKMYSISEVINIYPQLSKHLLTKYINEGLIPVSKIGNQRYFYKDDIENFLKSKIEIKNSNLIMDSWRDNE